MADAEKRGLTLSWQALLLALPALAVYLFNDQFLARFGPAPDVVLVMSRGLGAQLESASRLEFLAAMLLFVAVASAVIAAFAFTLWSLDSRTRIRIAVGVGALTLFGVLMLKLFPTPGIAADIGLPPSCPLAGAPIGWLFGGERSACAVPGYDNLLYLLKGWKWMLVAATAAVIFGAICCLAGAPPGSALPAKVATLQHQARRLNLHLYLCAMLMVSALLVQHGFLRWPRFAVSPAEPFDAHVNAIILYYGVGYSIFLASFYLPVAWRLGWRAETLKDGTLRDEILKTAMTGSAGAAKSAVAILAPALAGLLSAWIG